MTWLDHAYRYAQTLNCNKRKIIFAARVVFSQRYFFFLLEETVETGKIDVYSTVYLPLD